MIVLKIIVDASVGIKWFVNEELREEALRLRKHYDRLVVPDLFLIEVTSAAQKKRDRGEMTDVMAFGVLQILRSSRLTIETSDNLLETGLRMGFQLNHPVYDCLYLALARRLGGIVITHDKAFLKKVANSIYASLAHPLHDVDALIERLR